ncbi:MAG: hypothetical protein Q8K85_19670 [Hyphomicrobium sp.]|nr:hypothetical protein [Hyphomicrobium sp.]
MTDKFEEHKIDKLIADRKAAAAAAAAKDAATHQLASELAARVRDAFGEVEGTLRAEIKKANDAIKRGAGTEEFKYQPHSTPAVGSLASAELMLMNAGTVLSQYSMTIDATTGKIAVRSKSGPLNQGLTNVLTVKAADWADFLTDMYAGSTR